jgi:cell division protein FtsW (lipid II flippase)
MVKRSVELKYLFTVFLSLGLGFFLLHHSFMKRSFPLLTKTISGEIDLASYILNPYPNAFHFAIFAVLFLAAHFYIRASSPDADPLILPAVAFISGIGLLMVLRLAPDLAVLRNDALRGIINSNPTARVTDNVRVLAQLGVNHLTNVAIGVLAMVLTTSVFKRRFFAWMSDRRYIWIAATSALFILTWFFGTTINGRKLWLFGFQSIELIKLLVLFFIAGYLYNEGKGITFHGRGKFLTWCRYTIPYALASMAVIGPTVVQQDFGATMVLFAVCFIMLHLAGNKIYITLGAVSIMALAGWLFYTADFPHVLRQRVDMFLDPFGRGEAITSVLWSISTGGIFGNGIGFGLAHRIPEVQSDFNFAAICEEMGLVGGLSLMTAYAVLAQRMLRASLINNNLYKKMLVTGIALMIAVQSFIILAGNLNGIPLTGITLPFCSYGGSSLIVSFIMAGIGIRISSEDT